jgi:Flp pilus assembly protein TadG
MVRRCESSRRGTAAVELAVLLPFLAFLFVIAVDWARVFYYSVTITNCARQGALYGSDPLSATQSSYPSLQQAALADATNLNPQPTVTSSNGVDGSGNPYVAVTVSWPFSTITNFPGVPSQVNLSRTVQMRVAPTTPN